jgi:cytochrome P450
VEIDLSDPDLFAGNGYRPVFSWLRTHDPVHRHQEAGGPGYWVLTRYRDIVAVYADHETFSSRYGMRLGSDPAAVAAVADRMLIVTDPPGHTELRRIVAAEFGPARIAELRPLVTQVVDEVLDELVDRAADAGPVDIVDVVKEIPNRVVCALMGLPRSDWDWIGALTTGAFESEDEAERSAAHAEIFLYFSDLVNRRRKAPGADVVSRIATAVRQSGGLIPEEVVVLNCNGVLAGANETTRHAASGAVLALARHPEQWRLLTDRTPDIVPSAVEEVLRWTTPGVHAMRTAVRNTAIAGVDIREGDRVSLWNASANCDPAEFADAERFLLDRTPNRHLTFGWGRHVCLGARVARLELSDYLTGLARRFEALELAGDPRYTSSNFTWGLQALPVTLRVRAGSMADHGS